jgi:hypothetical protein
MYGRKTDYLFHMAKRQKGCLLSVETDGKREKEK